MKSRTALAVLTATALGMTGIASANADSSSKPSPSSATGTPTSTPTGTPIPTPTPTVTVTYPITTTVTTVGEDNIATEVVQEIHEPTTVTVTPPKPTDASSRMVEMSTLSERGEKFFMIVNMIIVVLSGLIQVLTFLVAANPQLADQLRAFIEGLPVPKF